MIQRFVVTFSQVENGFVASVVQTSGAPVLPPETPEFKGKSLASVEERVSTFFDALAVTDWTMAHNFAPVLTPELSLLLSAALHASEEAEAAEYRKVRSSHRAIEALASSGFSMRDISVFFGESKTVLQQFRSLGRIIENIEEDWDKDEDE
jgi:hypothetical protein